MAISNTPPKPLPNIKDFTKPPTTNDQSRSNVATQLGKNIDSFYKNELKTAYQAVSDDSVAGQPNNEHQAALASDIATLHNMEQNYYKQINDTTNANKFDATKGGNENYIDGVDGVKNTNDLLSSAGSLLQDSSFTYTGSAQGDANNTNSFKVTAQVKGDPLSQGTSEYAGAGSNKVTTTASASSAAGASKYAATDGTNAIAGGSYSDTNGAAKWNQLASGQSINGFSAQDKADAFLYAQKNPGVASISVPPDAQANISKIVKQGQAANQPDAAWDSAAYQKIISAF